MHIITYYTEQVCSSGDLVDVYSIVLLSYVNQTPASTLKLGHGHFLYHLL